MKAYVRMKRYTGMFTVASFITAKNGKSPNVYQQVNEKTKLCYIQIAEYYSEIKRNDICYNMDVFQK